MSPMPRMDLDFAYLGKLIMTGFKGFIVGFLWMMPVLVPIAFAAFVVLGVVVAGAVQSSETGDDSLLVGGLACLAGGLLFLPPVVALLSIPASVAQLRSELSDDMQRGMGVRDVMAFSRRHFGVLFRGLLILSVVGAVLHVVGLMFCYVGVFPAIVVSSLLHAHFMTQVYERDVAMGGTPLAIGRDEIEG